MIVRAKNKLNYQTQANAPAYPNQYCCVPETVFCKIRFAGDLYQSLRQNGYLDSSILSAVQLNGSWKVLVKTTVLDILRSQYMMDEPHEPLRPTQGVINVHGIIRAKEIALEHF